MSESRRVGSMLGAASCVWLLGVIVLGTRWEGIEASTGTWRDTIGLARWAGFWAGLLVAAVLLAQVVRIWTTRILTLVPLLLWFAFELRTGTLAPLAWLIYAAPTVAVWLVGTWLGDVGRSRWHGA